MATSPSRKSAAGRGWSPNATWTSRRVSGASPSAVKSPSPTAESSTFERK